MSLPYQTYRVVENQAPGRTSHIARPARSGAQEPAAADTSILKTPTGLPVSTTYPILHTCNRLSYFHVLRCRHIMYSGEHHCSNACLHPGSLHCECACPVCDWNNQNLEWEEFIATIFDDSEAAILTLSNFDFEVYVDTKVKRWIRDQYWMRVITSCAAKKQQVYKPVMTPDGEQPVYFDGHSNDLAAIMLSMNLKDGTHRKPKAALDHGINIVDVPEFRISRTYALGCAAEDMMAIVNDEIDERLERMRVEVDRTVALVNREVPALSNLKTDARPADSAGGSSGNTQGSVPLEQLRDEAASTAGVLGSSTSSILPTMAHITDGMEEMEIAEWF